MKAGNSGRLAIFDSFRSVAVSMLAALLLGCSTTRQLNPDDPTTSLIYMHIDQSEAPTDIRWFKLQQRIGPTPSDIWYYDLAIYDDGIMNHLAAHSGSYTIHKFGGIQTGFLGSESQWIYEFYGEKNGQPPVVIDKPGAYFLGSYKLVVRKRGLLRAPEFDLLPVSSPSESEVLQRLITNMENNDYVRKYSRPLFVARARLKEISQTSAQR